jgi:hypothetical protein
MVVLDAVITPDSRLLDLSVGRQASGLGCSHLGTPCKLRRIQDLENISDKQGKEPQWASCTCQMCRWFKPGQTLSTSKPGHIGKVLSCKRLSARTKSRGMVSLMLVGSPSTRCTRWPAASTTVASSVNRSWYCTA